MGVGHAACAFAGASTFGIGLATCPLAVGGLGFLGGWAGEKAGGAIYGAFE
jgi:hypothetical protein